MNQTPLHSAHKSREAEMAEEGLWVVPKYYGDPSRVAAELEQLRTGAGIIDLAQISTVTLAGPDARRFCNGMFTNNIKRLTPGQGNRNAMCDDRGRIQGLLDVYCTDHDSFLGVLEGVTGEWFEERYQLYIVFDDVQMTIHDGAPWVLSVQGPKADAILSAAGLPCPAEPGQHLEADNGTRVCRKDRTGTGGVDLLIPDAAIIPTFDDLINAGAEPVGHLAFEHARILAGRARWPHDGSDKTLVHELRLESEVCNFNKGCYLGQEVINRIDVKGQVTKRLSGLLLDETALPPQGSTLWHGEKEVGWVTKAIEDHDRSLALGIVRKAAWDAGTTLQIQVGDRQLSATVVDLPFNREP